MRKLWIPASVVGGLIGGALVASALYQTTSQHAGTVNTAPPSVTVTNTSAQAMQGNCQPVVVNGTVNVSWSGANRGDSCTIRVTAKANEPVKLQSVTGNNPNLTFNVMTCGADIGLSGSPFDYKITVAPTAPRDAALSYTGSHVFVLPEDYVPASCS
jgi:hypothetical protein